VAYLDLFIVRWCYLVWVGHCQGRPVSWQLCQHKVGQRGSACAADAYVALGA
jgi:hypothetical protein